MELLLLLSSSLAAIVLAVAGYLVWKNKKKKKDGDGGGGGGGGDGGPPGPATALQAGSKIQKGGPFNIIGFDNPENIATVDGMYQFNYVVGKFGSLSGASLWALPPGLAGSTAATLSYEVFIPPSFEWSDKVIEMPGGKFPGFCVGIQERDCATGGGWQELKGSFRVMWRENGKAIGYWYAAIKGADQSGAFLKDQGAGVQAVAEGTGSAGVKLWHMKGGGLQFVKNAWNTVKVGIDLGTAGRNNGVMSLTVNGVNRKVTDAKWRDSPDVKIANVYFTSFAGGGSAGWAFKTPTYARFRKIVCVPGKVV
jgi:hypothetical protein